jgi:hypothetical protein
VFESPIVLWYNSKEKYKHQKVQFLKAIENLKVNLFFSFKIDQHCKIASLFLLSMNEVNMKYWFRDFQKKYFYWFSGRFRTFYRRKTGCPNENFVRPTFERSFQVRHFFFWITEGIGPTGVIFVFLTSGTNSVNTNFWLLFHFHVKIDQFYCFWAWFGVKFYAELKKVQATRAQKRNLLVMKFL